LNSFLSVIGFIAFLELSTAAQTHASEAEIERIEIVVKPLYPVDKLEFVNLQESNSTLKKVDIHQQDLDKQ